MVAIWTMSAHFSMSGQKAKDFWFIFKEAKTLQKLCRNCKSHPYYHFYKIQLNFAFKLSTGGAATQRTQKAM